MSELYVRLKNMNSEPDSIKWLFKRITALPADTAVPKGTKGYNNYTTQKDHWLGWLDPESGTGTYPRSGGKNRDARYVYNHIVEPKLLVYLIGAAKVDLNLVNEALKDAASVNALASKSARIRRHVSWETVEAALSSLHKPTK